MSRKSLMCLSFAACLTFATTAEASHFRYGHVTWRPLNTSGLVEFTVTAAFRNGYGLTTIGQHFNETIGASNFLFGDGGSTNSTNWHVVAFAEGTSVVIARLDPANNGSDVVTHQYAGAGPFDARIDSCCRISGGASGHINNPDGAYIVRTSVRPSFGTLGNSSPVSGMPPIIDFFRNAVNNFLVPASDPNGNTITFSLATAGQAGAGFVQPGPPHAPNALTIDSSTGLITWNTTGANLGIGSQTLYSCQVIISDGLTSVAIDFLIRLVVGSPNNCPVYDYPPTPANGSTINGFVGQAINFSVQASDADAANNVSLSHLGLPVGASFTPAAPANPGSGSFSWTPGAGQTGSHTVNFAATDGTCTVITSVNFVIAANQPPNANCKDVTVNADGNCEGNVVAADVDDGSADPDGDSLTYVLTPPGPYPLGSTEVILTVTDPSGLSDSCTAKVTVVDGAGTPPTIDCPPDTTLTCGESTDPASTGSATGDDNCDDDVAIGHTDTAVSGGSCLASPTQTVITRTWTATDDAGNSVSCPQQITVEKVVLPADLHPTSCPNPLNRGSNGVIPAALLGSATFNVADINLSSVRLSRADCFGGSVAPNAGPPGPSPVIGDVGTPFGGTLCDCHTLAGDGYPDLVLKFKTSSAVSAMQLGSLASGTYVTFVITGSLNNGCEFIASDCMRLTPNTGASAPALVKVTSNFAEAWVDVAPADLTLDEGGFANFVRAYPSNTVVTLTASATMGSKPFRQWIINGVPQADGLRTISVKANGLMNLEARYSSFIPPPDDSGEPTILPVERK